MNNNEAKKLLIKHRDRQCTPEELALIESWYLGFKEEDNTLTLEELDEAKDKIWTSLPVHETVKTKQVKLWFGIPRIAAAAVILMSVSVGLYFYTKKLGGEDKGDIVTVVNTNILPGGKKALLTLANGKSIVLSDARNGKLANQTGTSIFKTANGNIVYNAENDQPSKTEYNQLSIPRGGYYTLTLADGTKVWLNSESTLKYPTSFVGNERVVELTGEGYFEVAHRKDQPFKVVTGKQTVEVLGTHFNINAYADEKVTTTTLLEGSVKVASLRSTKQSPTSDTILKPGQQSILKNNEISISDADTEAAVAWVNNYFIFNKEELGSIMRQLSRWYDVDVVCSPDLENLAFVGNISRAKNIKEVMNIMEKTKAVNFKIEGRRITVMH